MASRLCILPSMATMYSFKSLITILIYLFYQLCSLVEDPAHTLQSFQPCFTLIFFQALFIYVIENCITCYFVKLALCNRFFLQMWLFAHCTARVIIFLALKHITWLTITHQSESFHKNNTPSSKFRSQFDFFLCHKLLLVLATSPPTVISTPMFTQSSHAHLIARTYLEKKRRFYSIT